MDDRDTARVIRRLVAAWPEYLNRLSESEAPPKELCKQIEGLSIPAQLGLLIHLMSLLESSLSQERTSKDIPRPTDADDVD